MAMRALEIRINSLQDAQSALQNQIVISRHLKETGLDAVHFKIAAEVQAMVMPLISDTLGREKRFMTYIKVDDDSQLFILPKLIETVQRPLNPVTREPIESDAVQLVSGPPIATDKPFSLPILDGMGLEQLKELKIKAKVVFGNKMAKIQSKINELS